MRKIDCHVHIVGDGSSRSGCWFHLPNTWKRLLGRIMIQGIGLPQSVLKGGLDELYIDNLLHQIRQSDLDAAVILAQDIPYDAKGKALPEHAQFYVPNIYVAKLAQEHKELIPACSIHPGRPDALNELERCIEMKMPVLKLLPNCLNIDYDDEIYIPFWQRMAEANMTLLSHTGGEMTVKVFDSSYADPKKLKKILQCGVKVIAAHAAGRSGLTDPDWTADLLTMFKRFPNLYADNSALCTPNRVRTIKHILSEKIQKRILHGSDYPVPVSGLGPWLFGHIKREVHKATKKHANILQKDYLLKKAIGFKKSTFTRMDTLLKEPS